MTFRREPAAAGMIQSSVFIATLAAILPIAAYGQSKPTVTVINPVSSPVNTRITNAVIPVEVSNAEPIVVQTAPAATTLEQFRAFQAGTSTITTSGDGDLLRALSEPIQITGMVFQVNARGTSGLCRFNLNVVDTNDTSVEGLGSLVVYAGRSLSSPTIPFPNLTLPAGYEVRYFWFNDTGEFCDANFTLYAIQP